MGRPAIPPYGEHFRLEQLPYDGKLAPRRYVLKADETWFIRSDFKSQTWFIYHSEFIDQDHPVTTTTTFQWAIDRLLRGIEQGFYQLERKEP